MGPPVQEDSDRGFLVDYQDRLNKMDDEFLQRFAKKRSNAGVYIQSMGYIYGTMRKAGFLLLE